MNSSPGRVCCVLVLLLLVGSGGVPLYGATLSRIVGPGDPMPDRAETVSGLSDRVVFDEAAGSDRVAVVLASGGGFPPAFAALYLVDGANAFQRVVSTETAKPGGGTMAISTGMMVSVHAGVVYFTEVDSTTFKTAVYKVAQAGAAPQLIAAQDGAAPGGTYSAVTGVAAHAGGVVFEAMVRSTAGAVYTDLFHFDGNAVSAGLLGRLTTPVPGAPDYLFINDRFFAPQVRGGMVYFLGNGYYFNSIQGIYALPLPGGAGAGRVVVDTQMTVPGLAPGPATKFEFPDVSQVLEDAALDVAVEGAPTVFLAKSNGNTAHGIYLADGAGVRRIVDDQSPWPGSAEKFKLSGTITYNGAAVAVAGGKVAFAARDVNGVSGVFVWDGTTIDPVAVDGMEVGGVQLFGCSMARNGFKGNQLMLLASGALWRATLGAAPPTPVRLTIVPAGSGAEVRWDGQAAGPNAELQETPSLVTPNWQRVQNPANPYPVTFGAGERYFRLVQ